jgi:hypothetical protein
MLVIVLVAVITTESAAVVDKTCVVMAPVCPWALQHPESTWSAGRDANDTPLDHQ